MSLIMKNVLFICLVYMLYDAEFDTITTSVCTFQIVFIAEFFDKYMDDLLQGVKLNKIVDQCVSNFNSCSPVSVLPHRLATITGISLLKRKFI